MSSPPSFSLPRIEALVRGLKGRSIALVGMMGVGKTSVGRKLAQYLNLPFTDSDLEIEQLSRLSIFEIFTLHGEPFFRDKENKVIMRLLKEGQKVLATGGGAYLHPHTYASIQKHAISIWLQADQEVILQRVRKRPGRPLLADVDPGKTITQLLQERSPYYHRADLHVVSSEGAMDDVLHDILLKLEAFVNQSSDRLSPSLSMRHVPVDLGERTYPIHIGPGLLAQTGKHLEALAKGAACLIVTDENVAHYHLPTLQSSLDTSHIRSHLLILPPGEATKSYAQFEHICEKALEVRLERGDVVLAFGGGVIGDLAGFAASAIRRGVTFVQIPTSLLAQVDSSVGGKTGINSQYGKNLVGAFYQPRLVLADLDVLKTLPEREFRAGYAEMVKYGLLGDSKFFTFLEKNGEDLFARGSSLAQAIETSCRAKARIVASDETEKGARMLLNLGHTFGHALEVLTHYQKDYLIHGEGVAIGMACAFRFSEQLGLCSSSHVKRVEAHLAAVGLPTRIQHIPGHTFDPNVILEAMFQDKKVNQGQLTFILVKGIGKAFISPGINPQDVLAFLESDLKEP